MQKTTTLPKQFTYKKVKNLLSPGNTNAKTAKNEIETYILYLAPANTIGSHNVCPFASPGCKASCLYSAGRGAFSNVQNARINKTKFWAYDRQAFYFQLHSELLQLDFLASAQDKKIAIRLNGTSDIDHLDLLNRYTGHNWLTSKSLLFYDYTKNINVYKKYLGTTYKLTFSMSETNFDQVKDVLDMGGNVAAVFARDLPAKFMGFKVIDGDLTDLRYFDPKNVIIGLKAKGKAKKDTSGFVITKY